VEALGHKTEGIVGVEAAYLQEDQVYYVSWQCCHLAGVLQSIAVKFNFLRSSKVMI